MKKSKKLFLISAIFSCSIFFSCATSNGISGGTKIASQEYDSLEEEKFYAQNADSFIEKKLSNGIPVVIKKSKNQNDCAVSLVIDSVAIKNSITKSGLEDLTLSLMKMGSVKYSLLYISSLEYTDSTTLFSKVHQDYLEYGINFPKDRMDSVMDVFASTYRYPVLPSEEYFELYENSKKVARHNLSKVYKILNSNDNYFSSLNVTEESEISYKDVLDYHNDLQNASRIKIIASGNFSDVDVDKLYELLEQKFSSIKSFKYAKKIPNKNNFDFNFNSESCKKAEGEVDLLLGFYPIPYPLSDEYIAYGILSLYLDDLIYSFIKEKNNSAQDAGCGVLLSKSNIGLISVYDSSMNDYIIENLCNYLTSSLTEEYIQKKLDSYKRIYTSIVMSSELNAKKTLEQMASSWIYSDNPKSYIERPYKISKIDFAQVRKIFDSCINEKIAWVSNNQNN